MQLYANSVCSQPASKPRSPWQRQAMSEKGYLDDSWDCMHSANAVDSVTDCHLPKPFLPPPPAAIAAAAAAYPRRIYKFVITIWEHNCMSYCFRLVCLFITALLIIALLSLGTYRECTMAQGTSSMGGKSTKEFIIVVTPAAIAFRAQFAFKHDIELMKSNSVSDTYVTTHIVSFRVAL